MFELFAHIGGFGFFMFALLVLSVGIISAEFDSIFGAVVTFVMLIGGAVFVFDFPMLDSLLGNMFLTTVAFVGYILIGMGYGIWYRYSDWLKSKSEDIAIQYNTFVKEYAKNNNNEYPTNAEFRESGRYSRFLPSENLERISVWIAMWPWALFWDLCHKPIRVLYNSVYDLSAKALSSVSKRISDKIIDDVVNKK